MKTVWRIIIGVAWLALMSLLLYMISRYAGR